jgi:hypothetical protein
MTMREVDLKQIELTLFFTCSNMGALLCNYLLDEASNGREFSTMNGHLQFDPKGNNLSSYAYGQLRLEQAKLAIAWGVVSKNGWKSNVLLISKGLARAMHGLRLIEESMAFSTTFVSPT